MVRLTGCMVTAKTRQIDIGCVKKLNCWGSELADVSILRNMPRVEVLALSLNKISSLIDFEECWNLQELYLRKNNIQDLSELCYLQNLPHLKSLWLDENPCSRVEGYRMLVLRALPKLNILDDKPVTPEELQLACSRGCNAFHPKSAKNYVTRHDISEKTNHREEGGADESGSSKNSRGRCFEQCTDSLPEKSKRSRQISPSSICSIMNASRSIFDRSPGRENSTNPRAAVSEHQNTNYPHWRRQDKSATEIPAAESTGQCDAAPYITNQIRNHIRGRNRRPVARNSNLLSGVLCLVKELDYRSLEVLEMAVQCRIDELADRQEI